MAKLLAGRRSGIVRMFPETDKSTMLPNTTPKVNRGRAEVGKKVNTMTERNKVASPTSNPGSDTSPRNKNPRWPAKRKFQDGGKLIPRKEPLNQAQLDSTIQAWRQSPEWYNQASGKAEMTDSPIDMVLLGGAANYAGKGAGFLSRFLDKKAVQVMDNAVTRNFGKYDDAWEAVSGIASPVLKAARFGIPASYGAAKVTSFLENK